MLMEFLQQHVVGMFQWASTSKPDSQELNSTSAEGNTLGSIPGSAETGPKLFCLLTEDPLPPFT